MSASDQGKFCFAIDRGGTFTDVWAKCPDGKTKVMKLLSEDPSNYDDAPREGIRRILQQVCEIFHEVSIMYSVLEVNMHFKMLILIHINILFC